VAVTGTTFTKIHDGRSYGYSMTGPKWRCDVCGRTGYGDPNADRGRWRAPHWSDGCKRGHSPCEWCGRQTVLRLDGTPRVHTRCPNRPDDVELLRRLAADVHTDARLAVRGPATDTAAALLERLTTDLPGGNT
jgi:hypothetical protein